MVNRTDLAELFLKKLAAWQAAHTVCPDCGLYESVRYERNHPVGCCWCGCKGCKRWHKKRTPPEPTIDEYIDAVKEINAEFDKRMAANPWYRLVTNDNHLQER